MSDGSTPKVDRMHAIKAASPMYRLLRLAQRIGPLDHISNFGIDPTCVLRASCPMRRLLFDLVRNYIVKMLQNASTQLLLLLLLLPTYRDRERDREREVERTSCPVWRMIGC